jgi:hypothetical protein
MGITLIDRIVPKNDAFRGMVTSDQVISVVTAQTGATLNVTNTSGYVVYLCDATSGAITVNLPTAVGNTAMFTIKKTDSSANSVTIDGNGSETIDGATTCIITNQYNAALIVSNNTNWSLI